MNVDSSVPRRRPPVSSAGPAPELSGLDFAELRAYRAALSAEEDKASYWRRLIQGRIDVLSAARASSEESLSVADLVRVLGDTGSGRSRHSLMRVPAPEQLPDLPDLDDLSQLWSADPEDVDEFGGLIERLQTKERMLSQYRSALHERIDAASGELIVRYRTDPRAALGLLPPE